MTREPLPWINLLEAIRVVVRLLPDGERLADIMADEWIKESLGLLWRCHGPVDEVWYARIYGEDWGATHDATNRAYKEATEILESVLLKGKVRGFGVCCAKQAEGQRPITEIEWATRRIELKDGLLATPFREKPEHFPAILDIRVNAEDVRRECAKAIKVSQAEAKVNGASAPPSDDNARVLIRAAMDRNGGFIGQKAGAELVREKYPGFGVKRAMALVKELTMNDKPGPKRPRKNRAK
jgi:hypothetical protein